MDLFLGYPGTSLFFGYPSIRLRDTPPAKCLSHTSLIKRKLNDEHFLYR